MTIDRFRIFHFFKYTVYALLMLNVYLFFAEDWAAASHRFVEGVRPGDIIEGFAQSIDTLVWVILLLMFELQTSVLADDYISKRVKVSLHVLRALCYVVIVYAFFGYLAKLLFLFGAAPLTGTSDLCSLGTDQWAYTVDLDEYADITAENCASFSDGGVFYQLSGLTAVVDRAGLIDITRLAWVDVINAGVWLLVVLLLEVDVRLQERNKFEGLVLRLSNLSKYVLYSILLLAAVYWGIKGDFVDFWDAFLWLFAFAFIEMNVFEWRQESLDQEAATAATAAQ
ncbi:MAG: hypothetical protein WD795_09050 [Woeseia sp.]